MNLDDELELRRNFLEELKQKKEAALSDAPPGRLRANWHRNGWQYFQRMEKENSGGKYIRKGNRALAIALGQKDYDQRILTACDKELAPIKQLINARQTDQDTDFYAEEIFEALPEWEKSLITPFELPLDQLISKFENQEYEKLPFKDTDTTDLYTMKGERVRSKSEQFIADQFYIAGIPYHYEMPVNLKLLGEVHPDFSALNRKKRKIIRWEHFGRMDDPTYNVKAFFKIYCYDISGYNVGNNFIFTCESKDHPLSTSVVLDRIHRYLLS